MFKEIFKRIIELLPKSIRDNIIFEQVIEAYQNELSKDIDTNSLNMSTSKDIYNTLINDYSDLIKVVKVSTNDNILLHLTLITIQGVIVLKISDNSLVQRASIKAVDHHSEEKNIDLINETLHV